MAMNPGMKMLAMAKATQGNQSRMDGDQMRLMNEGADMRQMNGAMEMRRRRDDRGRYMEDGREAHYWPEPHMPPQNRAEERMERMEYRGTRNVEDVNPYGDEPDVYKQQREERRSEMTGARIDYSKADGSRGNVSYFKAKPWADEKEKPMGFQQRGQQHGGMMFDKQTAMEWVESMEDMNGIKGGTYTWHQAQQYGRNLGITGEERLVEFYAIMNAMQSDYVQVAKKFGVDKPEFYACMAKAFIEDPDAVEDKVARYYECVAKHDG